MARVPVPAHALVLSSAPASVGGPALGTPAVNSLIDTSRSWRLAMSLSQAIDWIEQHHPPGLPQDGSSSGDGPDGTTSVGISYRGPKNEAWQSADLEVEVASFGRGGTVMRADAVIVWLDPVPVPDNASGPRIHVSVAGGCPGTDESLVGVTNRGADLKLRLLPAGQPTAGLECRYYGMNGHPWRLQAGSPLSAAAARRLASRMARIPLSHALGGVYHCPMDDGSVEIIALSFPSRPDVDLWVNLNGCGGVGNGFIQAGAD